MSTESLETRWALRPLGRHGLVLLIVGVAHILIGVSFRKYDLNEAPEKRVVNLTVALRWFSLETWGLIFILVGVLVVISSRWPRKPSLWGYSVLTGLAAIWSGFYFASVIIYRSTANNLAGGITWALFAFLWWAISGLIDPVRTGGFYEPD